ncbi:hypothetical protein TYRP_009637 [Tyrophagus putrescentiae]|nr:hypothetical protein TYRP_009637 [Tyrophagus putrescentiae]
MKKSGFLRGMLDGLRSTVSQPTAAGAKEFLEANVEEALKPSHFQMETSLPVTDKQVGQVTNE